MKRLLSMVLSLVLLCSCISPVFAASDEATKAANTLYELGLFSGTGTDSNGNPIFDLDRAPTRHEAVTMLVNLLGKREEALSGNWDIPFTDVADWAKPFVGYAYANGLTSGTSATTYGGNNLVTVSQYLTFVLKVLGYEAGTDFRWDAAWELSDKLGITNGEYNETTPFTRGDIAIISYNAIFAAQEENRTDVAEKSIDLQGYWLGSKNDSGWEYTECYYFNGNDYSCVHRGKIGSTVTVTRYDEGTFSVSEDTLTLTCKTSYNYLEGTSGTIISNDLPVSNYNISEYNGNIKLDDWEYSRSEQAESIYNQFKNYVMEHNGSPSDSNSCTEQKLSNNSNDYAYLAGSDFRSIRREYSNAVAQGAYVYAYTDLNGDLCVLTSVHYKIASNWHEVTLHNITKGTKISDPINYYKNRINGAYGATKLHYMDLWIEMSENLSKMLGAMSDILETGRNTFDGTFVDAATLNL